MTDLTTKTLGSKLLLAIPMGTAALFPIDYEASIIDLGLPDRTAVYQSLETGYAWEKDLTSFDPQSLEEIEEKKHMNIIMGFSKRLIENSKNLDDEILEKLNENFWDLL